MLTKPDFYTDRNSCDLAEPFIDLTASQLKFGENIMIFSVCEFLQAGAADEWLTVAARVGVERSNASKSLPCPANCIKIDKIL